MPLPLAVVRVLTEDHHAGVGVARQVQRGEDVGLGWVDDVRGALGISDEVRNGFSRIRVSFKVKGDAPPEKLREIVQRAQARSAVFDMVSNGVPVEVGVVEG